MSTRDRLSEHHDGINKKNAGLVLVMFGARPLAGKLVLVIMVADMLKNLKVLLLYKPKATHGNTGGTF
jgi:hypothetical protein